MDKKGFSKTGLILVISMLICLLLCLCVVVPGGFGGKDKSKDLNDEGTPNMKTLEEGTPIFLQDKRSSTIALMKAFDDGEVVSVTVQYDFSGNGGAGKQVTSKDDDVIFNVYKALKNLVFTGETDGNNMSQYYITFATKDGTEATFTFKGEKAAVIDDTCYSIEGSEALWGAAKEVQ